jgi:transcriptional regulator with PAS, ATPase and Fis domain
VAVNCAALPEELIESELFGHERGAFTGASERRAGCFERATAGTLLLDELAEMPVHLQAKLLRVIEDSRVRPLGGGNEVAVDVRVIASTNRPVEQAIQTGEFREDLFYRLSVFLLPMPPLRERRGDIPLLVDALISVVNSRHGCQVVGVEDKVMHRLEEHRWPGNVRELRNVLERAVILANRGTLKMAHLPTGLGLEADRQAEPSEGEPCIRLHVGTTLAELEKALIGLTLANTSNDKTRAARILGISRKTMFNRLREYRALQAGGLGRVPA